MSFNDYTDEEVTEMWEKRYITPTLAEVRTFDPDEKTSIRRGAKLLDRIRPSWFREISAKKLDLGSCDLCVLGQLYDNPGSGSNGYARGLSILAKKLGEEDGIDSYEYGFGADEECANRMWRYEIRRRRRAAAAAQQ